jgi:hypothetical protein
MRYCLGDPTQHGNLWAALALLPFGLFFDFLDGKVARWRKKSSMMGQELDSLADLVSRPQPPQASPTSPLLSNLPLHTTILTSLLPNRSPSASPPRP